MSWGSFTKSLTKPFKEVGKAIHWTDIRTPLTTAAAVAGAIYTGGASLTALAGTGAASALGTGLASGLATAGAAMTSTAALGYGALAGGYLGLTAEQQSRALAAQRNSDAATLAAAEKMAASAAMPVATPAASAQVDYALAATNAATAAKRRYSLTRTVNGSSLLGGFGSSIRKSTLG